MNKRGIFTKTILLERLRPFPTKIIKTMLSKLKYILNVYPGLKVLGGGSRGLAPKRSSGHALQTLANVGNALLEEFYIVLG